MTSGRDMARETREQSPRWKGSVRNHLMKYNEPNNLNSVITISHLRNVVDSETIKKT